MPSKITVKLDPSGRWSISLRINDTRDLRLNPTKKQVGIDLGTCLLTNYQRWRKSDQPKESSEVTQKTEVSSEVSKERVQSWVVWTGINKN